MPSERRVASPGEPSTTQVLQQRNEVAEGGRALFVETADPRVHQANERTLLSWVRTGSGLMAFGFVVARLGLTDSGRAALPTVGASLVGVGVVSLLLAAGSYWRVRAALLRGHPVTPSAIGPLALTGVLAAAGIGLCASLLLL